jgi:2-polyprenyl-6-methoxyphenol hydroxylase-like FAD-dependent oxidoreductase
LDLGKLKILIVGAGIAGLGLSLALRRRGCSADIIERNAEWRDVGMGLYLPGNALRALRALQIDAYVEARGAPIRTQRFYDHRGRLLTEVDAAAVWRETGPCVAVHRADLHVALRNAADTTRVRMGLTITSIDHDSASLIAHFSDDTRAAYDLIVGADGVGSAVRRLVCDAAGSRALKQWSWRFVIPCPPTITTWSVFMDRASACLMMPIGRGQAYCYVDLVGGEPPTALLAGSTCRLRRSRHADTQGRR